MAWVSDLTLVLVSFDDHAKCQGEFSTPLFLLSSFTTTIACCFGSPGCTGPEIVSCSSSRPVYGQAYYGQGRLQPVTDRPIRANVLPHRSAENAWQIDNGLGL